MSMMPSPTSKTFSLSSSQEQLLTAKMAPHNAPLKALTSAGGRPFLVGGAVRDIVLGFPLKDFDLEIHGLAYPDMDRILTAHGFKALPRYGIFQKPPLEIALPRREKHTRPGYHGFDFTLDPHLSFEAAAARRDFTVNAMGICLTTQALLDPYGGLLDGLKRCLTPVAPPTFREDPLRLLRAANFMARFNFTPSPELNACIEKMDLRGLSKTKIFQYCRHILTTGTHLKPAIDFLQRLPHAAHLPLIGVLDPQTFPFETFLGLRAQLWDHLSSTGLSKENSALAAFLGLLGNDGMPMAEEALPVAAADALEIKTALKEGYRAGFFAELSPDHYTDL